MTGIEVRLSQLLNAESGKGVVVAFDHGGNGVVPGGEDPGAILATLGASGAEALLLGPGLARHAAASVARPGGPRLIVALDHCVIDSLPGQEAPMTQHRQLISPVDALGLGATAAKMLLPVGLETSAAYADSAAVVARNAHECARLGLPLMVEPALWGSRVPEDTDQLIAHAARVSVELGAHLLKIPATVDPELLNDIVQWSPVPVFVLGGAPANPRSFGEEIGRWMQSGAAGVAVGRNVWSRPSPGHAIQALQAAVHDADIEACVRHLEQADTAA
ncbi:class I fructose-bisphosphate aldolase [Pseudactinotalea sp.]|uniref:class I fructose-bisphosphate aldolase n=1 Tax=Pseudactinotalea sp. TaxID=1926260 RepID=UPI003B3B784A